LVSVTHGSPVGALLGFCLAAADTSSFHASPPRVTRNRLTRPDRCICRADCEEASIFATSVTVGAPQYGRRGGLPSAPFSNRPPDDSFMQLPIAPTPETTTARIKWHIGLIAAAMALTVAFIGFGTTDPALATPQQAPNSRVVLDLPPGYVPSPLFAVFQND